HLTIARTVRGELAVRLASQPTNKPHCPSVDVLFESAAAMYGSRTLGVVMTGMGNDGRDGAAWIKAKGGSVLTEAEESCVIYGMPRSVDEAGLSDARIPLTEMAEQITKRL
ncbi:MAG TPA: CheB methylesterase domain-containing protein, partial [Candidatus Kapabacteria bacterium]|nr:CheB methylesterase domain-containing protein [Candidatus Kapabacteria bacterium]